MWTCTKCNENIEDDLDRFCWNCGAPRETLKEDAVPQEEEYEYDEEEEEEPVSQVDPLGPVEVSTIAEAKPEKEDAAPPIMPQILAVKKYDPEVFASQFPEWDLLPPTMPVRRIKRSL